MDISQLVSQAAAEDNVASTHTDIDFFSGTPGIRKVLDGPTKWIQRPLSWHASPESSSETLFARTLNSAATISHLCMLIPRSESSETSVQQPRELLVLLQLGADLAGHEGVCHGGVLSTLLDEIMGTLVVIHAGPGNAGHATANLNIDYVKPVSVPGIVMVRTRLEHAEGRKVTVSGEVIGVPHGSNDGVEVTCTRGRALFIRLRK